MPVERRVTTQDVSWFLDQHNHDQLELDPPYQRRSVWSPKDRRFFLDTIFRGYPSPQIFLHKQMKDGKTIYNVVDGKQRLETIFLFADNKIAIDRDYGDIRLAGKKWRTIKRDDNLARLFWDYVLPVEFTNVIDTNLVNEVFDRLNRNSRKLTEQELRHAKYDGWLVTFVERESESSDWETLGIVTTARAKRMRDVQFISELLVVLLKDDVSGFDQDEINAFYARYDYLADLDIPFDEERIKARFEATKKFLLEAENKAAVISKYTRDFNNFYSLWAVIALNYDNKPDLDAFIERYSGFMERVNLYRNEKYLNQVIRGEEKPGETLSLEYYQSSVGASTEQPQRIARYKILREVLIAAAKP